MQSSAPPIAKQANRITMTALAALVGLLGALGAILFVKIVAFTHNLFILGNVSFHYDETLHTIASPWGAGMILVPIIGAVIVIFILDTFAADERGLSIPLVIYRVFYQGKSIQPAVALAKTLASAITIGTGGSVGREGPIFQIGATLSSIVSDFTRLSEQERKILVAAATAACTAVIFRAPLSGIVFVIEFMLVPLAIEPICWVTLATIVGVSVEYFLVGLDPIFTHVIKGPVHFNLASKDIVMLAIFGIIIGFLALIFIRGIYFVEAVFNKCFQNPYIRHMIGMALVGLMIYFMMYQYGYYYIEGVGFATIQDCLLNRINGFELLMLLVMAKLVATCLTLGSGASGGIFSPSLFIGATIGSVFGVAVNVIYPDAAVSPVIFTILGMAAMLASMTGALITSIILIVEMMRESHLILSMVLPMIIVVVVAYLVRHYFSVENVYTVQLSRRGVVFRLRYYN